MFRNTSTLQKAGLASKLRSIREYQDKLERTNVLNIKNTYQKDKIYVIILIIIAVFQCCINVSACLLFILESYHDYGWISTLSLIITIYFTIEILINFYYQPKPRFLFFFNHDNWVDFLTVLPEYLSLFLVSSGNVNVGFLRILRVFKIMRIVKFRKTFKKIQVGKKSQELNLENHSLSRLKRQFIMLIISLFATLFIATGIISFVQETFDETATESMEFADSFYFMLTTVSTIGYGDIYMIGSDARIIMAVMIVIIFTIFGNQISKIVSIMRESDRYDIKYNLSNHIIIFNNKSINVLTSFLLSYISGHEDVKVLVVDDVSMSNHMKNILDFFYENLNRSKVYFLSTRTGINTKIISKSSALFAKEIYFLSNPFSNHRDQQDKRADFEKTFLRNSNVNCKIYIQFAVQDEQYLINLEKDMNTKLQQEMNEDPSEELDIIESSNSSERDSYQIIRQLHQNRENKAEPINAMCYLKI